MKKSTIAKVATVGVIVFLIMSIGLYFNTKETSPKTYFGGSFIEYSIEDIELAWEKMPVSWKYFMNKQRYDKHFLVNAYQTYQIILYKKRAQLYFPFIEAELKKRGMPDDIKYLAVAESGLINDVISPVWASGIWQFMPKTWERFGLVVSDDVDERFNFEKATMASLDYLEFLYSKFDNRTLAIAAYNRGEWGISRAMADQGVNNFYDLNLNNETANYIFRILAIKYTMKGIESLNLNSQFGSDFELPEYEEYTVNEIEDLKTWAKKKWTTIKAIRDLNPWIFGDSLPYNDEAWVIKVSK